MRIWRIFLTAWRRGGAGSRSRRAVGPIRAASRWTTAWSSRPARPRRWPSSPLGRVSSVLSLTLTTPTGYSPAEIRAAYGIDAIAFSNGTITGDGAGETIAIVDAYSDPNIAADLAAFDAEYGLSSPPSFTVDNLGATSTDAAWALETALDVEWAHAIAPEANIVLVEASSDSVAGPVRRGQLRQQPAGRWRGVDELGRERVLDRVELRQLCSRRRRATRT